MADCPFDILIRVSIGIAMSYVSQQLTAYETFDIGRAFSLSDTTIFRAQI